MAIHNSKIRASIQLATSIVPSEIIDVKHFINFLTVDLSLNFHPDNEFEDYGIFSTAENQVLEEHLCECIEVCEKFDEDIYSLCIGVFNEINS